MMSLIRFLLICVGFVPCSLFSMDVIVHIPNKGSVYLQVQPEEAMTELKRAADELLTLPSSNDDLVMKEGIIEVMFEEDFCGQSAELTQEPEKNRDYYRSISSQETKDIKYIVTTLANKPPSKLLFYKKSIYKIADRIDHVHPFRFLEQVFTDKEMKVGVRNIRRKGWVWKEFVGRLKDGLNDEHACDNLLPYIDEFASTVGVNPGLIVHSVNSRRWDELVKILIDNVPGDDKVNRYDI